MPRLIDLPPGTRFMVRELDLTGTLMMANDCRARVRLDRQAETVEFTHARSVEQPRHQTVRPVEMCQHTLHFVAS